jgi:hypothetical protein
MRHRVSLFSRCLPVLALALLAVNPATAADKQGQYSFCHGYIKKALGELPIEQLDRNDMWLAWNVTVKKTIVEGELDKSRYQAGRDAFSQQLAAGNTAAMEAVVEGDCELGKNPTWRWW